MFDLLLVRHAKSGWLNHMSDIDRPLSESGVQEATLMGHHLGEMDLCPDCLLVSGAHRAQETARLFMQHLDIPDNQLIVDKELYLADRDTLMESIEVFASEGKRLMIVAHNPGMDDTVNYLASKPPKLSSGGRLMETCTVACFRIASLESIGKRGQGELVDLLRPEDIQQE